MKRRTRILLWFSAIVLVLAGGALAWWRYTFPYGKTHRCDTLLSLALSNYAAAHGGRYPFGESSPEASLSLLYREGFIDAEDLRPITVSAKVVRQEANSGRLLTPETCGWHYVEGLRESDSPELALFWDKAGVGHWGERLRGGGYIVTFVGRPSRHILASEWTMFLETQRRLLASRPDAQ